VWRLEMNLKIALFVFITSLALSTTIASADDYTIDFPTSDANNAESVLIICNITTKVCTKEVYNNSELAKKTYDQTKSLKALKRVDDVP
jgi:hypothetical protein